LLGCVCHSSAEPRSLEWELGELGHGLALPAAAISHLAIDADSTATGRRSPAVARAVAQGATLNIPQCCTAAAPHAHTAQRLAPCRHANQPWGHCRQLQLPGVASCQPTEPSTLSHTLSAGQTQVYSGVRRLLPGTPNRMEGASYAYVHPNLKIRCCCCCCTGPGPAVVLRWAALGGAAGGPAEEHARWGRVIYHSGQAVADPAPRCPPPYRVVIAEADIKRNA
jgi:hypothetical protein